MDKVGCIDLRVKDGVPDRHLFRSKAMPLPVTFTPVFSVQEARTMHATLTCNPGDMIAGTQSACIWC